MTQTRTKLENVLTLSRRLMHDYYNGDYEEWFSRLAPNCVWIGTGEPMLFGADAIKQHFTKHYQKTGHAKIYQEDYYKISLGDNAAQVFGQLVVGPEDDSYYITTLMTLNYHLLYGETKLVSHHFSYEFMNPETKSSGGVLQIDLNTRQFIRDLLIKRPKDYMRVAVKSGSQILYIDPNTIVYVGKSGKHTELVCIDRIVSTTASLAEVGELLPDNFYSIHRSYIVNLSYVTSLTRYKLQMISGITLPVPALDYMQVKADLKEKMGREMARRKRKGEPR